MVQENMISQKLRILLAERNIRANRLSVETGIAQSTLSAIISGKSKSIQFDTIEKICIALDVEPRKLFTPCEPIRGENHERKIKL